MSVWRAPATPQLVRPSSGQAPPPPATHPPAKRTSGLSRLSSSMSFS